MQTNLKIKAQTLMAALTASQIIHNSSLKSSGNTNTDYPQRTANEIKLQAKPCLRSPPTNRDEQKTVWSGTCESQQI
jgi:hypothetical protein